MFMRWVSVLLMCLLSLTAFSDATKMCADQQKANCGRFCMRHHGMQSCVIDITKRNGTCTCADGTSHMKSK